MVRLRLLLTLFCGLLPVTAGEHWTIADTAIFSLLDGNSCAVSEDLTFYLMDAPERRIRIYDASGQFIGTIGGKGEGPGEFRYLSGIRYENGLLYCMDAMTLRLSIFKQSGEYFSSSPAPRELLVGFPYSALMVNGWVYTNSRQIQWVDDAFENRMVLAEIEQGESRPLEVTYVPGAERPVFSASRDRKRVYLYPAKGKFEILVFDVTTKTFRQTITRDILSTPFDKEFGEKRLQQMSTYRRESGVGPAPPKPEFPAFFPAIEHLETDPDGLLVIFPGVHMMNRQTPPVVLDELGQKALSRFPVHYLSRILAVQGAFAFVAVLNDDELEVRRVAIPDLERFFRGSSGQ